MSIVQYYRINRKLLAKASCISWGIVSFGMIHNLFISPFLIC